MASPARSRCSVRVVLPASGCEMIAKVRRRAISAAGVVMRALMRRRRGGTHRRHVSHIVRQARKPGSYSPIDRQTQHGAAGIALLRLLLQRVESGTLDVAEAPFQP